MDELFDNDAKEYVRWESKIVPAMRRDFRRRQLATINRLLDRCTAGQEAKYYKIFPMGYKLVGARIWDAISILEHAVELNEKDVTK